MTPFFMDAKKTVVWTATVAILCMFPLGKADAQEDTQAEPENTAAQPPKVEVPPDPFVPEKEAPDKARIPMASFDLEMGLQCIDNVDNNGNGLLDCEEPSCQGVEFCLERIYYIPEPMDKPMKAFVQLGLGAAFPNWDPPVSEGQQDSEGNRYVVPYLPDIGPMADLTLAYIFLPWVGVGVKGMFAGTNVQSRDEWYEEDYYKFDGFKILFNISAVVRFQYPFKSIVPFINVLAGYSYVQYRWVTFTRFDEENETMMTLDRIIEPPSRHITFAFELGFDAFIVKRKWAAGSKLLLPFAATAGSGMDNTGLLLTITYTPLWPEKRAIKPKYLRTHGIE